MATDNGEVSAHNPCIASHKCETAAPHSPALPQTILALLIFLFLALPAYAHRVNLFAWVESDTIRGSVYFAGGGKAQDVTIRIIAPDGHALGSTVTNARGEFTFKPSQPVDHRLIADTGDGHRAEFLISADAISGKTQPEGPTTSPSSDSPPTSVESESDRAATAREIAALRQQIDEQAARIRTRDLVAGVGYIVGLAGLAYYFLQRKARRGGKP